MYNQAISVPAGFSGSKLQVFYPSEAGMVVRLRDDITVVNPVTLAVTVGAAAAPPKASPPPTASTPAQP